MMKCDDLRLASLLDECHETDSPGDWAEMARHVTECLDCQQRLSELAASDDEWREASTLLSPMDPADDLPEGLEQPAELWNRPAGWTEAMARSLLAPAKHPEMLGRIGRYDVERLIGSGGMGVVLKAHDTELNRPVAIKILAPYLAENVAARQRFAREARAAAAVVDDHVVPIHNVETDGSEIPFLVMQYVAGGSLQQRINRQGPLQVAEILRLGLHTAKGLAAAHAQGLIHRDVKPSNILLDESVERALLTDFGLARAANDVGVTRTGFHPGTPQYMSPEQVRGEDIDARSDLFGLGCVLYALCTGHPPFQSDTGYAVLRLITDSQPQPVRELNPDIPEWLEQIVMKLLQKSPDERFISADKVVELLQGCLSHVQNPSLHSVPAELVTNVSESGRNGRWTRWLMSGIAAFGLIFGGWLVAAELNKGTLTITTAEPGIPIRILKAGEIYDTLTVEKTETSVRVAAGSYVVEIDGDFDGLVVEDEVVELKRGQDKVVRIVHQNDAVAKARQSGATASGTSTDTVLTDVVNNTILFRSGPDATTSASDSRRAGNLWAHVEQFNRRCQQHPRAKDQPPLTVDEVKSSIRWALTTEVDAAPSTDVETLQRIVDSGLLPNGWTLCGEFVQVKNSEQRPLASAWQIRLADSTNNLTTTHLIRMQYLRPILDPQRSSEPVVLPDADSDEMPLAAGLQNVNSAAKRTIDGQRQSPVTEQEVMAAIRAWQTRRNEAPVVNKDFAAFQRIAETGFLPADAEFEVLRSFQPGDDRVYFIDSVRIRMPQSNRDGWTFAYTIRERFISSRPVTDADRRQYRELIRIEENILPPPLTPVADLVLGQWIVDESSGTATTMTIFRNEAGRLMLEFLDASGKAQQGLLRLAPKGKGKEGRFVVQRQAMGKTVREWFGEFRLEDDHLIWQFTGHFDFSQAGKSPAERGDSILEQPAKPNFVDAHYRRVPTDVRRVTFRAHLDGKVETDPVVRPGEIIRVVPDPAEPLANYDAVLMKLPKLDSGAFTPDDGENQLHYLRGWAVGRMGDVNGQTAGHSNTSDARRFSGWTHGWLDGFREDNVRKPLPGETDSAGTAEAASNGERDDE